MRHTPRYFEPLKQNGLNSDNAKSFLNTVITSETSLGRKLQKYLVDVIRIDRSFFFTVTDDFVINTQKLELADLESSEYLDELLAYKKEISKYPVENALIVLLKEHGQPNPLQAQWKFYSGYFKLIIAFASLPDECGHSNRVEKLGRLLRMSLTKGKADQHFLFKQLINFHTEAIPTILSVFEKIEDLESNVKISIEKGEYFDGYTAKKSLENRIEELRLCYEYAKSNTDGQTRNVKERSTKFIRIVQNHTDLGDENSGYRDTKFIDAESKKIIEDDITQKRRKTYVDNNYSPKKGTEKSSELQQTLSKVNYLHAQRNNLCFPTNPRQMSLEIAQTVFDSAWHEFSRYTTDSFASLEDDSFRQDKAGWGRQKKWKAYGAIVLAMIFGRSLKDLISEIQRSKSSRTFLKTTPKNYIYNTINVTPLNTQNDLLQKHKISDTKKLKFYIPEELNQIIGYGANIYMHDVHQTINDLKKQCNLPYLLESQLNNAFHSIIRNELKEPLHADLITGTDVKHCAQLYYSAFDIDCVSETYFKAVKLITEKVNEENRQTFLKSANTYLHGRQKIVGSEMALRKDTVSNFFDLLRANVKSLNCQNDLSLEHLTKLFNARTLWMWHIISLFSGIRPVNHSPGFLNQFDLESQLLWISDKSKDVKDSGRLIPVCNFLKTAIQEYLLFIEKFAVQFNGLHSSKSLPIKDIIESKITLLQFYSQGKFHPVKPSSIKNEVKVFFKHKDNWLRHQLRWMLTDISSEHLIQEIYGHEDWDIQMFEPTSSASLKEMLDLIPHLDQIAVDLNIMQLEGSND